MAALAMTLEPCPVCGIPLASHEVCPSPACPCHGLRAGSAEAEVAAERRRSRPSVAAARAMTGEAALDHLDRMAWLDYARAIGAVFDVVIEHRELP